MNSAEWQTESLYNGGTQGAFYPEHDAFLVLDVTVTGTKGQVYASSLGWNAHAGETEYGPATSSNFAPKLTGFSALTAGQSARGYVTLDVQRGPVTLVWTGPYGADPLASWDIPA